MGLLHFRMKRYLLTSLLLAAGASRSPAQLQLKQGDHISIIGNTLADRLQHEGTLEAMIQQANPTLDLSLRNLGFAADELTIRQRSENFGSPDQWLAKVKTDVVFAFFGFNESFKGPEGVEKFKADLDKFLKDTKKANYSGKGSPRIVLFSPIAHENLKSADFPDGTATNDRLRYYVEAMQLTAKANDVQFVDLFAPSKEAYAAAKAPLTINGIHLKPEGYQALAPAIFKAVFGKDAPTPDPKLVAAVNDKNVEFHSRYRTVDGYNVYGGRSQMAYEQGKGGPKLLNYTVMQEEMTQRDVLTANREKRVWSLAKGKDIPVDDSNLPPVTDVKSNKPGPLADGSHPYLSGEETIAKMKPHEGTKVNLFADEKRFPELANPVQMAWDTKGRLFVAVWPNYPERTPTGKNADKILVFEDKDGDGKADTCKTYLDGLNCPTGFQFYKDGVLVMQAPDLWFVRDTDGDGVADTKEVVLNGMDSADSHHTTNAMCLDPGGATYLSDGVFHRTQVETLNGPARHQDGCIWRYEPRTGKFHMHIAYGFANPHGRVFDRWGNDIVTDATGNNSYFGPAISGWLSEGKHKGIKDFWNRPSRPCPATALVSSRAFPDDWQGNFLNANVISFQGIYRVNVEPDGSGLKGTSVPDLISSKEENFRPICMSTGPEGAIYFCDWSQNIIGHLQHHLRDLNRDHLHGRIYRITYEGRPLLTPKKIAGEPIENLVALLTEPEDNVRERAKIELGNRDTTQVLAAVTKWAASLDKKDKEYEHHLTEALWVHQWHNVVNLDLLKERLKSPEPNARAAAVRVMLYWRDRVPEVLSLLRTAAADESPRVRLEAVRAASYFDTWEAADAALVALSKPTDYYLDYVFGETIRQLEPVWRKAIADGKPVCANNPAGVAYLVKSVSTPELLKLPKSPLVYQALLTRPDVQEVARLEALDGLAKQNKSTVTAELVNVLTAAADLPYQTAADLGRVLVRQPAEELKPLRDKLNALTAVTRPAPTQQAALAAIIIGEGSTKTAWQEAQKSAASLRSFLNAIPLLPADVRAGVDPTLRGLFKEYPATVKDGLSKATGTRGRYVRIELPRRGTLTLAEVEVLSGGKNIAPTGTAKQINTSNSGEASRAIDGNKDGTYGGGGQTHTAEDSRNPWWELDLKTEQPVDSVTIYNRTESGGVYAKRLDGFTLTVLDGNRQPVFTSAGNKATVEPMTIAFKSDPSAGLAKGLISALVSTGVNPAETFKTLSASVQGNVERTAAAQAMLSLPRTAWSEEAARGAVISLTEWAKTVPAADRTSQDYLEAVQATSELAGALPGAQSAAVRKTLRELSVSVFVVKTVPEQMRYNTARLVVEAGKPFEVIFENVDVMPHNMVFSQPGSREEIGLAATTLTPDKLDAQGRAYVPASDKIFAASHLLEPGKIERLKLTAPAAEGKYDITCTFPGHYLVMWGKLVVTKNVDEYLAKHPQPEELPPTFAQPAPEPK